MVYGIAGVGRLWRIEQLIITYTALAKGFAIDPIFQVGALFQKLVSGQTKMLISPKLFNIETTFFFLFNTDEVLSFHDIMMRFYVTATYSRQNNQNMTEKCYCKPVHP